MTLLVPKNINLNNIIIKELNYSFLIKYNDNDIITIGIPFKLNNCKISYINSNIYLSSEDILNYKFISSNHSIISKK